MQWNEYLVHWFPIQLREHVKMKVDSNIFQMHRKLQYVINMLKKNKKTKQKKNDGVSSNTWTCAATESGQKWVCEKRARSLTKSQ